MLNQEDRNFVRSFVLVLASLVLMTVLFAVLANLIGHSKEPESADAGNEDGTEMRKAIEARLAPVATVVVADPAAKPPQTEAKATTASTPQASPGQQIFESSCGVCHSAGVAGAPKIGHQMDWAKRIPQGRDVLVKRAITGFMGSTGVMPPKGGFAQLSDDEVGQAVDYMLASVGGSESTTDAVDAAEMAQPVSAQQPAQETTSTVSAPAAVDGEKIYNSGCNVCHDEGIAGAPKVGDQTAWKTRIVQGQEMLVNRAISGFVGSTGVMPPKGGFVQLSDDEIAAAVAYMVSQLE